MSSIQYDYSTLSTSIIQSELGSNVPYNILENSYEIAEETSSEGSCDSTDSVAETPPTDRFKLVYLTFALLGVGTLLPWNFFITATDYWMYKFRDTENGTQVDPQKKTDLQASFTSYLTLANNVPYVMFLIVSTIANNKISQFGRMMGSLMAMFILFVAHTSLIYTDTDSWQILFFSLTMLLVVLISIASAVLQSSTAGLASVLPPKYMHVMVLGQAVAGIFATIAQIISLVGHCNSVKSALAYFLCADVVLLLTFCAYIGIQKSDFFQFFLHSNQGVTSLKEISGTEVKNDVSVPCVIKQVWPYAVSLLLDFWVTIGIFPGLAVLVVSESADPKNIWTGKLFLPLCCFLLFNISDFCGRAVGGWLPLASSLRFHLLFMCISRIVFIPLFLLCNAYPRSHLPVAFPSDLYYIAFITMLGFTNGYFVVVAMICGTKCVSPQLQETAGAVLSTFLGGGLMLGAISSYIFIQIL